MADYRQDCDSKETRLHGRGFPAGLLIILLSLILFSCNNKVTGPGSDNPAEGGPPFAPPDGECMFILGQANETVMESYISEVRQSPVPAGFAFYTSLSPGAVQNDLPRIKAFLNKYPNTVLQLAVWTGELQWGNPGYYLDQITSGTFDLNISALASACRDLKRPVYIRFGYEFDGSHNAYPPDKYIAAYRHFVDKMRAAGVDNAAYVWHSWGVEPYYGEDDYPAYYPALPAGQTVTQDLWYPGDDYVDWTAVSIFGIGWGNLKTNTVIQRFLDFSVRHGKPLMIAESAAIKTTNRSDPDWVIPNTQWFIQVFDFCNSNDAVKAFTYINVDWEADNPAGTWGNTQIQDAAGPVISYWNAQIPAFLHADRTLFETIRYP